MGILDDAKDLARNTGEKIQDKAHDAKESMSDKLDEMQAKAKVEKARAEENFVEKKNDVKEHLRDMD